MMPWRRRLVPLLVAAALAPAACGDGSGEATLSRTDGTASSRSDRGQFSSGPNDPPGDGTAPSTTLPPPVPTTAEPAPSTGSSEAPPPPPPGTSAPATAVPRAQGEVALAVTEVASGLDTVWAMAWDPEGRLWFTERQGRLTRLGAPARRVEGVVEGGEGGLMGLEFDDQGRVYVMYTGDSDNRVVRLEGDGSQTVLADGIAKAAIHNGGRLRRGPGGGLYAATGDAGRPESAQDPTSLNGKVLRIDTAGGEAGVFTSGHRNVQGLCVDGGGRLLATEHGPDRGDEINVLSAGGDGGWPGTVGNGIRNYTPTIAPAGCAVYTADLIPQWRGSLLFVTLKGEDLRRLTFGPGGAVTGEEVLYDGAFGRLRDVSVGPDGAVYLATSNRDGRGSPAAGDDRILRIAPAR